MRELENVKMHVGGNQYVDVCKIRCNRNAHNRLTVTESCSYGMIVA